MEHDEAFLWSMMKQLRVPGKDDAACVCLSTCACVYDDKFHGVCVFFEFLDNGPVQKRAPCWGIEFLASNAWMRICSILQLSLVLGGFGSCHGVGLELGVIH